MVICKYFLRGTCRFGENCKNEHSYNDNSGSVLRKKQDIDPNVIIKSVSNDMDKAENGNQWPFSCYGPFQGKSCFPGFEDKCFEEIRLGLYEAERNGTAEQYKQQLTQLINETRMKMRSLQNPTPEATNVLKELFNSNPIENQSTNTFTNSVFGNNPSNQSSIFGNTGSQNVFATQPVANNTGNSFTFTLPENKNIFGNAANNQTSSGSIFSQNNQPGFSSSNSIFGGGPTKSIFANTHQTFAPNTNVFQTNNTPTFSTSSGSIFGNQQNNQLYTQQPTTGGSIFAHSSPFTQNSTANQSNTPFAQNNQTPIQPNPSFVQNNTTPNQSNPFTQQNTVDPFRSQQSNDPFTQNSTDIFKQNVFQQNIQPQSPFNTPSSFGQNSVLHSQNQGTINSLAENAKSIFGSMTSQVGFPIKVESRRQDDATIYSKLEDLTEKDIKCFEAASFEFGKIPENPPTLQMC